MENSNDHSTSLLIKNLEFYMNRKFFEKFFYYFAKDIKISNIAITNKNKLPYNALITFSDHKNLENFIANYKSKCYPNSQLKIEIKEKPDESDLKSTMDIKEEKIFNFQIKYNELISVKYEKSLKEDGLIYQDEKVIEAQAKVITYLLKKIGSSLLKGESVMNISLPVTIFDTRTILQL